MATKLEERTLTMRELCEQRQWYRQVDLAHYGEISRQAAHLLWTGKRLVGRRMAKHLAPRLGVSIETLINLEAPTEVAEAVPGVPRRRNTPRAAVEVC